MVEPACTDRQNRSIYPHILYLDVHKCLVYRRLVIVQFVESVGRKIMVGARHNGVRGGDVEGNLFTPYPYCLLVTVAEIYSKQIKIALKIDKNKFSNHDPWLSRRKPPDRQCARTPRPHV